MRKATLHRRINHAVAVVMGAILAHASAQIPCQYEVTLFYGPECDDKLPPPVPSTWGISETAEVVGYYDLCNIGPQVAFVWNEKAGLQPLATLPGFQGARAYDLIDADFIVGRQMFQGEFQHPILWDHGIPQDLGLPEGADKASALAVNTKGQIAGSWHNSAVGPLGSFLWDQKLIDISDDFSTINCQAFDINERSQITGWMGQAPSVDSRAFIWEDGKVIELPPIPGGFSSEGRALNDQGEVVGRGRMPYKKWPGWVRHAFYWSDGVALDLGTLPGCAESLALDINSSGVVVGYCSDPDLVAFVWADGVMVALDDLVPPELGLDIHISRGINDAGQIVAVGADANFLGAGILLTPIYPPIGELDGDCQVGASDLLILLSSWGPCEDCPADLDNDGQVGASDLLILLANWG